MPLNRQVLPLVVSESESYEHDILPLFMTTHIYMAKNLIMCPSDSTSKSQNKINTAILFFVYIEVVTYATFDAGVQ